MAATTKMKLVMQATRTSSQRTADNGNSEASGGVLLPHPHHQNGGRRMRSLADDGAGAEPAPTPQRWPWIPSATPAHHLMRARDP